MFMVYARNFTNKESRNAFETNFETLLDTKRENYSKYF